MVCLLVDGNPLGAAEVAQRDGFELETEVVFQKAAGIAPFGPPRRGSRRSLSKGWRFQALEGSFGDFPRIGSRFRENSRHWKRAFGGAGRVIFGRPVLDLTFQTGFCK